MNKKQLLLLGLCLSLYVFHGNANAASKKCYTRMVSNIYTEYGKLTNVTREVNHGTLQYPKNSACKAAAVRSYTKLLGPRGTGWGALCTFSVTLPNGHSVVYQPESVRVAIQWDRVRPGKERKWNTYGFRTLPCFD